MAVGAHDDEVVLFVLGNAGDDIPAQRLHRAAAARMAVEGEGGVRRFTAAHLLRI